MLVLDLASSGAAPNLVTTVTNLVIVETSKLGTFEVLSSRDLRAAMNVEADKQLLGACTDASCLGELAGALSASLVVYGEVGKLDKTLVVSLHFFDVSGAKPLGREIIEVQHLDDLPARVRVAVSTLTRERTSNEHAPMVSAPLLWSGVAIGGVGVGVAAVSGYLAASASQTIEARDTGGAEKQRALATYPLAVGGVVVGMLGIAGGGALAAFAFVE